jgi:hypothetical protein
MCCTAIAKTAEVRVLSWWTNSPIVCPVLPIDIRRKAALRLSSYFCSLSRFLAGSQATPWFRKIGVELVDPGDLITGNQLYFSENARRIHDLNTYHLFRACQGKV